MGVSLPAPAGSFNLSAALRALGIRDPRVIPALSGEGEITPVISFGTLETFSPEVIEARTIVNRLYPGASDNRYRGMAMQSIAPGGTIIENLFFAGTSESNSPSVRVNIAPIQPFVGTSSITPWSIGGQAAQNIYLDQEDAALPAPLGGNLGGSHSPNREWPLDSRQAQIFSRIWVPAAWWWWFSFESVAASVPQMFFVIRCREIPQSQGAA